MKTAMLCTALLALACAAPAHADEIREQTYMIAADVDASGHITATRFDADVPAPVTEVLTAAVKRWQFVPARNDGQPVPAHTFVRVKLRATPDARGGLGLRISYAGNGPRMQKQGVHPKFPAAAHNARASAFLLLEATVQPDGRLTDMTLNNRFEDWHVHPSFKTAAMAAARQWRAIPEQVNGQPTATRVRIPINFYLTPPSFTPEQLQMLREADRREAVEAAPLDAPLPSDQEMALDSPLQPQSVDAIISAS